MYLVVFYVGKYVWVYVGVYVYVWVCGCVGVWVCGCVGVWVCGCVYKIENFRTISAAFELRWARRS
jgi:hypothetical protein